MITLLRIIAGILFLAFIPLWPLFWLHCRITARRCPACGSKWRTELIGEWDGEDWVCRACGTAWLNPYK